MIMEALWQDFFNYSMTSFKFVWFRKYFLCLRWCCEVMINTNIMVSDPFQSSCSLLFGGFSNLPSNAIARFLPIVSSFFLPVVTGSVAVTICVKWIYDPLSRDFELCDKSGHVINQKHFLVETNTGLWWPSSYFVDHFQLVNDHLYIAAMGNDDDSRRSSACG